MFHELYENAAEFLAFYLSPLSLSVLSPQEKSFVDPSTFNPDLAPNSTPESTSLLQNPVTEPRQALDAGPCQPPASTASDIHPSMRRELEVTKKELARSQLDVQKLDERCKTLEKSLRDTRDLLRARESEIERLRVERDEARRKAARRRSSDGGHGSRRSTSRGSLPKSSGEEEDEESSEDETRPSSRSSGKRSNPLTNADEERAQVQSSEVFLTKADSWSGVQIIQAIQDLNSEVLQLAASVTDNSTFDRKLQSSLPKDSKIVQNVTSMLGHELTQILSTNDNAHEPTFVQFALQGCTSKCIARSLSSFCMGYKPDGVLAQIYGHLYFSEPQPVSSRWRALSHHYLHSLYPKLKEFAINELTDNILQWTLHVMTVAGASRPDTGPSLAEALRKDFTERVQQRISRAVYKLAQVTREEIMSTNFEVILVEHGTNFDPRRMVDTFTDYTTSRGTILCTTELGLSCTTRKATDTSTPSTPASVERRLLLLPKVVLESALEIINGR